MTESIKNHKRLFTAMCMTPLYEEILRQESIPSYTSKAFNERLIEALENWKALRAGNAIARRLKEANIRYKDAAFDAIDYEVKRNLNRTQMENLKSMSWVEQHQNIVITGKAGCGKTWIAGALANACCRKGYTCRFVRLPLFLKRLSASHGIDQGFMSELNILRKVDVLVLDDWGLGEINALARSDLLEIIEHRCDFGSTIVTSVLPVSDWSRYIGDPTYSDAILERLVLNAHRIELKCESMRRLSKYGAVAQTVQGKAKGGKK